MKFAIVTPCFNPGRYLLETLQSVIGQSGDFSIHYHVQDAQSTDGTVQILDSLAHQIDKGFTPIQCRNISFSYSSEPDDGMYDAINRGFKTLLRDVEPDVVLWINADDLLAEKALRNLRDVFIDSPQVEWIIGRTVHLNEDGEVILDIPPVQYDTRNLALGRHDGKLLPYVTQEATAWRYQLFRRCGLLDSRLRLAGDFEYWVRMARLGTRLYSRDIRLGCHRKRKGQLSESKSYQWEIEQVCVRL